MKRKRNVVWIRQDLRLHDNEALMNALKCGDEIIPVYVFDERQFSDNTSFGFSKTNKFRAKFIIEAIQDLRNSFQQRGIDLVVRVGKPEEEVFNLCKKLKSCSVYCNMERTQEEVDVQNALEKNLWTLGKEIIFSRGKMLYYTQDLPFPVSHTPDVFTHFRKEVEKYVNIRQPLDTPESFPTWTTKMDVGSIPSIEDFGHELFDEDERAVLTFKGGETAGLKRLHYYLWETDLIANYKNTRNGLIGGDYSSKFSAWLAQGCLSPKTIYYEIKRYERERKKNKSTYSLFFELLWRDFFRLMGKKHGNRIFQKGGIKQDLSELGRDDMQRFINWKEGKTGVPFIDANMRELNATGFMSNRGRQNVASFLVKDLKINWQIGAEYFESQLIDYDACSNWVNWNYVAGIGNDPRDNRYFNILSQGKRYDPKGEYIKLWIPELRKVPVPQIFNPSLLSIKEQARYKVILGVDYPNPMINPQTWV